MKNKIKHAVLFIAPSLTMLLGGCVGESVTSDGAGNSGYSDSGYSDDWGNNFDTYLDNEANNIVNQMYTNFLVSTNSGTYLYKKKIKTKQKLIDNYCSSGQLDIFSEKNNANGNSVYAHFNNCIVNGAATINGNINIIESVLSSSVSISTSYQNVTIQEKTEKLVINSNMKQLLTFDSKGRINQNLISSSDLNFSVGNKNKEINFNFSQYRIETNYDLSNENNVIYSTYENYIFDVNSPSYSDTITIKTEEPLKGDLNGNIISKGRQVVTDSHGNQERFKKDLSKK